MASFADPDSVRSYYEHVDDEYDALLDPFAADVTYDRPGRPVIEGIDALEAFYREERPLEDGSHAVHSLVVDGDTVAVRGRFEGEQDGEPVAFGFADFHRFDVTGDIAYRHTYTDRDSL